MARRDEGAYPQRSVTEEQRSQTAFCPKTLRAAGLLPVAGVGSFLTARCGDARNSPPWPQPKSLAAGPLPIFKQALSIKATVVNKSKPATPPEIFPERRAITGHINGFSHQILSWQDFS